MSEEVWKDVVGWEGRYQVSNLGNVRSLERWVTHKNGRRCHQRGRVLSQSTCRNGYKYVNLHKQGHIKKLIVHRLVLKAFSGPSIEGMVCRHLDGSRANNNAANLAWGTPAENCQDRARHGTEAIGVRNGRAKLDPGKVREIRQRSARGESTRTLARSYSMSPETIRRTILGKIWKHVV